MLKFAKFAKELCFILCFSLLLPFAAFAESGPVYLEVEDFSALSGDEIEVPVYLSDFQDIEALQFNVRFPDGFEPIYYQDNQHAEINPEILIGNPFSPITKFKTPTTLLFLVANLSPEIGAGRKEVVRVRMRIPENTKTGKYAIHIQGSTIVKAGESLHNVMSGILTVTNPNDPVPTPKPTSTPTPTPTPDPQNPDNPDSPGGGDDDDTPASPVPTNSGNLGGKQTPTPTKTPKPITYEDVDAKIEVYKSEAQEMLKSDDELSVYNAAKYLNDCLSFIGNESVSAETVEQTGDLATLTLRSADYEKQAGSIVRAITALTPLISNVDAQKLIVPRMSFAVPTSSDTKNVVIRMESAFGKVAKDSGAKELAITTSMFDISLRAEAFSKIESKEGHITFIFKKGLPSDFSAKEGVLSEERPVYSFAVQDKDGNSITDLYSDISISFNMLEELGNSYAALYKDEGVSPVKHAKEKDGKFIIKLSDSSVFTSAKTNVSFNDCADVAWAEKYIVSLAQRGIVSGVGNNNFAPQRSITREEFTKMIVEALNLNDSSATCDFYDVKTTDWFYPYIAAAKTKGIISGMGESIFGTGNLVTRQDMATIATRAAAAAGINIIPIKNAIEFNDQDAIAGYAKPYIDTITKAGIINGMDDGGFAPNSNATRAQAAKIICLIANLM